MKTTSLFYALGGALLLALSPGCGKEDAQSTNPTMTPEETAVVFDRSLARAKALVDSKDYQAARDAVEMMEKMQLTPEQQKQLDAFKASIPAQ